MDEYTSEWMQGQILHLDGFITVRTIDQIVSVYSGDQKYLFLEQ